MSLRYFIASQYGNQVRESWRECVSGLNLLKNGTLELTGKQVIGKQENSEKQKSGLLDLQQLQYDDGDQTSLYNRRKNYCRTF